jgi:hypothetical protein
MYTIVKNDYNRDNTVTLTALVWAFTENGRKQNSQKRIIYEFGNSKVER